MVIGFTSEIPSAATAACAKQFHALSYFLHEACESLAVLPKTGSANNTCFKRGFWKFMGVITRSLITSETAKLCLVLGRRILLSRNGFQYKLAHNVFNANTGKMKLILACIILNQRRTCRWQFSRARKCVSVCVWASELCISYRPCSGNPSVMLRFACLSPTWCMNNNKNWVWLKLSSVISVTILEHAGTGPSIRSLCGSAVVVNHVCFSSWHPNTLT